MGNAGPAQLCIVALVKMQMVLQTIKYIALIGGGGGGGGEVVFWTPDLLTAGRCSEILALSDQINTC